MAISAQTSALSKPWASDGERFRSFGLALDAVHHDVQGRLGEKDLGYVRRMRRFSRVMEVVGRVAIHFSVEPIVFSFGVIALWLHKQVEATEIGHTALHGAYDRFGQRSGFYSKSFRWKTPIDEKSWLSGHNLRHHGHTNHAGKDPDIHFGTVRLTEQTPWQRHHRWQLPLTLGLLFPNFGWMMNLHFTGLNDLYLGNDRGGMDFLPDRSKKTIALAHFRALRKFAPYYGKEYVLFPLLAGPFWWKVLLGNWLSEVMRDIYTAATIYCGHVGENVASYPEGDKAKSRGEWYARQVEATNNFEVSWPVSVLCGGLDRQIEHHLFSKLPPERLREIAPEVRRICREHGVPYKTASWPRTLKKALAHVAALSQREPSTARAVRATLSSMA